MADEKNKKDGPVGNVSDQSSIDDLLAAVEQSLDDVGSALGAEEESQAQTAVAEAEDSQGEVDLVAQAMAELEQGIDTLNNEVAEDTVKTPAPAQPIIKKKSDNPAFKGSVDSQDDVDDVLARIASELDILDDEPEAAVAELEPKEELPEEFKGGVDSQDDIDALLNSVNAQMQEEAAEKEEAPVEATAEVAEPESAASTVDTQVDDLLASLESELIEDEAPAEAVQETETAEPAAENPDDILASLEAEMQDEEPAAAAEVETAPAPAESTVEDIDAMLAETADEIAEAGDIEAEQAEPLDALTQDEEEAALSAGDVDEMLAMEEPETIEDVDETEVSSLDTESTFEDIDAEADQAVEQELDAAVSGTSEEPPAPEAKPAAQVPQPGHGQAESEQPVAAQPGPYSHFPIPQRIMATSLNAVNKPFKAVPEKAKDTVGIFAVITCIISMILAALILLLK